MSTTVNVSLPESLRTYVEERVASGNFGTPGEFIRDLIRQDREQRLTRLETELVEALESGMIEVSPEELGGRSLVSVLRDKLAAR